MEIERISDLQPKVYDAIYLSPHLDDAAFSCSNHIRDRRRAGQRVLVVSVFTAGKDSTEQGSSVSAPFLDVARRREEDREAMRELDVDYHHLDLQEALIRYEGGCTRWLPLIAEVTRVWIKGSICRDRALQQILVEHIEAIIEKTECPWLLGPAGVGFHPDHLVVHSACCQVAERIPRLLVWHYCEFPYCTYSPLLASRRFELLTKSPYREVEEESTANGVEEKKRLFAVYDSQIEPVFGSLERLEETVDDFPNERFLEMRLIDQHTSSNAETDRPVASERTIANSVKGDHSKISTPVALFVRVLCFDFALTFMVYLWCKHGFDWDEYNPKAWKSTFSVFYASVLRVSLLICKPALGKYLCTTSTVLCLVACVVVLLLNQVKSLVLAVYFCAQLLLGYIEQKFVKTRFPWQHKPRTTGPMNVLMISDYWPPQTHGISTHTFGITTALRESGCKVHVYTTNRREADLDSEDTFLNCSVVNYWNPDVRLAIHPSLKLICQLLFGDFDVVHLICPSLICWPVIFTAWLAGKPVYCSAHCHEALGKVYMPTFFYWMGLFFYSIFATLAIYLFAAVYAAPTRNFIETHPLMPFFSAERALVVPSSVDDERFHTAGRDEDRAALQAKLGLDDSHCIWLLVSRLAPEKDIHELLRALAFAVGSPREDGRRPVLVIAGDGPLRAELENEVSSKGLPVHFLGFIPNREVPSLYRACDVCATNSVHETFGLTIIESLACGTPMVMPHCGVFDELYGEALGEWMYKKNDVEDLAKALECASQLAARERLAVRRREGQLSPNLFWSWREAAVEQMKQYRASQRLVEKARFRSTVKTILAAVVIPFTCCYFFS